MLAIVLALILRKRIAIKLTSVGARRPVSMKREGVSRSGALSPTCSSA